MYINKKGDLLNGVRTNCYGIFHIIIIDFIVDFTDDEIGYFVTLFLTYIGLGICLTYILYMNGMV